MAGAPRAVDDLASLLASGFLVGDIRTENDEIRVVVRKGALTVTLRLGRMDAEALLARFHLRRA